MSPISKAFSAFAIALAVVLSVGQALAEFKEDYTASAFEAAQSNNKHIVIEVFKKGCGTCAAQQPSLQDARAQYPDAVFLKFDFANNNQAVTRFKVVKQSTIIVFKGIDEVARLVGETDRAKILAAIGKGV